MNELNFIDILIIIVNGIIEGITEWLPVSSTGHMLIFDAFVPFEASEAFKEMFFVVIQLGAILAVVTIFFKKMMPFWYEKADTRILGNTQTNTPLNEENGKKTGRWVFKSDTLMLWVKVVIAILPSVIAGLLLGDWLDENFGNSVIIATMLILYGIAFIVIERLGKNKAPKLSSVESITYAQAFIIGLFQVLSLIPGTSRSGVTIIGALLIGVSRVAAAEFTFFLAVPTMLGASALKILKFGFDFTASEIIAVVLGMAVAYIVSLVAVKFLMDFVKKHTFSVFGWYRIALGAIIIILALTVL